jgi:hypothetical protein
MNGTSPVVRIAMWSGPRNISTAMMRAFGNRADTVAVDEPFYAAYLAATGLDHPMRAAIIAGGETDADAVAARLLAPLPNGKTIAYQKQMTHHMLPHFSRDWIDRVASAFLIRAPEAVLASYDKKREAAILADIGFPHQAEIFDRVADRLGHAPPVIEGRDVLTDPGGTLRVLCEALGVPFDQAMLGWAPGPRPEDGVWAQHWYGAVWASTGFDPPRAEAGFDDLPDRLKSIAEAARPFYERLARHKLGGGAA